MTEGQAQNHPGVLAGTHRIARDKYSPGGWRTQNITRCRALMSKWRAANRERLAARMVEYRQTDKGQEASARHEATIERILFKINVNAERRGTR